MTSAAVPVAPVAARLPPHPGLLRLVGQDLRWAFRRPYGWLLGIGINLVLSLAYLVVVPLRGGTHRDWAVLVGTYFAVFVLADVTTTNVLGVDTERTRLRLLRGISLTRILVVKNLALLVIVGLPTLVATAVITIHDEPDYRLVLTLPGVLYPVLDLARRGQPGLGAAALLAGPADHPVAGAPASGAAPCAGWCASGCRTRSASRSTRCHGCRGR